MSTHLTKGNHAQHVLPRRHKAPEDHLDTFFVRLREAVRPSARTVLTLASAAAGALTVVAGVGLVASYARVTLEVDGVSMPVTAWGGTVGTVLNAAGVDVAEHDLVQPSRGTPVPDGGTIIVRTAHPYSMSIDGVARTVWSASSSADAVLADAAPLGAAVELAANRSALRAEVMPLVIRSREVTVRADGVTRQARAESGESVDAVAEKAGVNLHPNDRVFVTTADDGSLELLVSRVVRGESSEEIPIPFKEVEQDSDALFEGESRVTRLGEDGVAARTQWSEEIDSVTTVVTTTGREVLVEPLDQIRSRGTKAATPQALLIAGIDPKASLEKGVDDNGNPYIAYTAGIGSVSSQAQIEAVIDAMTEPADKVAAAAAAARAGMIVSYKGQSPQDNARIQVAAKGWSDAEFQCLVNLWERESHWNPSAANASSGAYGIPQALPGSKMASAGADWQTNPATQITWGLGYIAGRYGTPCSAWAHSNAVGWY